MAELSIIMLAYNRENYVKRAIDSILAQSFRDFEFVIVDNGSSDSTGAICDSYEKKDSRVKVIHKPKGNIGSGRNAGINASNSEFIAFIDDDDYAEPDMMEFLLNLIKTHNADISICGSWRNIDGVKAPKYIFDEMLMLDSEKSVEELLKRRYYNVGMPTKMFKGHFFDKISFLETGVYDDITTSYKIFAESKKTIVLGKPKYSCFRHENNNSKFTTNDKLITPVQLEEYLKAFRDRTVYLFKKLPGISDLVKYSEWSYMLSMCNKIMSNNLENCYEQYDKMKNNLKINIDEFSSSSYLQEFEKNWIQQYITEESHAQ